MPAFQDEDRQDPASGQPSFGQQLRQVPRVDRAGPGVPLAAAGEGGVSRLVGAAWEGARLPSRAELAKLTAPAAGPVLNAGYRSSDVLPVVEPGLGADQIHHLVGNLQVWCGDGPGDDDLCCGPAARWLHGAAWNTPGTPQEIHRARWRHLAGSSRGVGIRLVRDGTRQPVSASALAERLTAWITGPARSPRPTGG